MKTEIFIFGLSVAVGICVLPVSNKLVVKKISNGKIQAKDINSGTDKIFSYDTINDDFHYVAEGDTLTYQMCLAGRSDYRKRKVFESSPMPDYDSVYARKQRELFNQQSQQMSEKQI